MPITLPSFVAPNELIQSAWGNAVVDALDELDDEKLNLTGGTLSGNLAGTTATLSGAVTVGGNFTCLAAFVTAAQQAGATALTRKDYVDAQDDDRVAVAGDTMTGQLQIGGDAETRVAGIDARVDGAVITAITNTGGSVVGTANGTWHREGLSAGQPGDVGGVFHSFRRNGTQIGSITIGTGPVTDYNTTSDARIKTNVGLAVGDGLDTVDRIVVRRYLRDGADVESVGVFAQELYDTLPQAVTVGGYDPLTEPWQVAYSNENIVGHLVLSVQQLKARIAVLEHG